MPARFSDAELLSAWRQGNETAGNTLFRRHFPAVRRFFINKVSSEEFEDLVQATFMGCVESAERFRGDASFRTFLFAIARRQLFKHLRDRTRKDAKRDFDAGVSSIHALGRSPSSALAAEEQHGLLLSALQRVPVEQQALLELHYWEDMRANELAEVFEVEPTTARTRLHRARRALEGVFPQLVASAEAGAVTGDLEAIARALGRRI